MSVEDLYPVDRVRHMPFFYYPTVNTDTDVLTDDTRGAFTRDLTVRNEGRKAILYLHVPFCRTHCSFCFYNINVVQEEDPVMRAYTDALLAEMKFYSKTAYAQGLSIEHVFIGGGTPTRLPDAQLRRVLEGLREHFDLSRVVDFTIEMNLETMSPSNLELCHELGVNRVSFGWQTSVPRLRKFLALVPSEETLADRLSHLERLGYPLIWDIMYALPGQTTEDWNVDLQRSIELGVACIDIHRTDLVPPAPLYHLVRERKLEVPTQAEALEQYLLAYRTLIDAGYEFNTFQQFNRPDVPSAVSHYGRYYYRSSHDLLALGPGAMGIANNWAYMNERDIAQYAGLAKEGGPFLSCAHHVSDPTWQERDFVLGMGQLWSVPKDLLRGPLTPQQDAALDKLIGHGAVVETEDEYRLADDAIGYHFSVAGEFQTKQEVGRNVGYLRSMPSEIVWNSSRKRKSERV
ncbi:MAG: coproporphyrinogen-III oxidase family protein [Candidatus Binatia bacterium]|nr:coproporphyrinogen-III oxidase family protein [Candidatus Binatia bacterium]